MLSCHQGGIAMSGVRPLVFAAVGVVAVARSAEGAPDHRGTKADYERTRTLRERTRDKVFRTGVRPRWSAEGGRFWYRVGTAPGRHEFVAVDAERGTRAPAFDHARVAAALGRALGEKLEAGRLPVDMLDFGEGDRIAFLWAKGSWWRLGPGTGDVTKLRPGERPAPALPVLPSPHNSRNKGGETYVTFTNRTAGPVDLVWIDRGGKRKKYASLGPGESRSQHTFAGHVWAAVCGDDVVAAFEAAAAPGLAVIDEREPPPKTPEFASGPQGKETHVTFVNRTGAPVRMHWVATDGARKPYARIEPGARHRQHTFERHVWLACDEEGRVIAAFRATAEEGTAEVRPAPKPPARPLEVAGTPSPDGRRTVFVRRHNVELRDLRTGDERALTTDGDADDPYQGDVLWSPDSKRFVVVRRARAEEHRVHAVESSPRGRVQPKLHSWNYLKPGDRIARPRPCLFDAEAGERMEVPDGLFRNPWSISRLRWDADGRRFTFLYNERGHRVLRVVAVDAETGAARALIEETPETFVDYSQKTFYRHLEDAGEIIWMSERDGWNHLYLFDARTGRLKNRITRGEWVVRGVDRVDAERREVWFRAMGIRENQDPYHVHYARVGLDGTGLTILTRGDGTHEVEFSPDRKYLVDTWSRVDLPPVCELRRSSDGRRICELERADWGALLAAGWRPPERFVAKGRDGVTDIHGVVHRTMRCDTARKHPVIECIYAGPHGHFVPKSFRDHYGVQELTELGFIVVQIDGMGTNWRSKRFHDVAWQNIGDGGFPDRIPWIKAAAARHPEMDASRVGIYGGVGGGTERAQGGARARRLLQGGSRRLRLSRQPHGQGLVERGVDGVAGRPALRGAVERLAGAQARGQAPPHRGRARPERRPREHDAGRGRAHPGGQGFRTRRLPRSGARGGRVGVRQAAARGLLRAGPHGRRAARRVAVRLGR
jgi:dipeptidyl aminopeptidase/acylaminoacyl peptidase